MGLDNYLEPYEAKNSRDVVIDSLHKALDKGLNYIDTAQGYGNGLGESIIGAVLKERRHEAYIATKVPSNLGYDDVIRSVDASLKHLQTDYIDVMKFLITYCFGPFVLVFLMSFKFGIISFIRVLQIQSFRKPLSMTLESSS
ncbi:aldo/keto reductase [Paenibacillus alginolyticus]|nr:aldo/keto reductase [Paenibacillus alginolyticus]